MEYNNCSANYKWLFTLNLKKMRSNLIIYIMIRMVFACFLQLVYSFKYLYDFLADLCSGFITFLQNWLSHLAFSQQNCKITSL